MSFLATLKKSLAWNPLTSGRLISSGLALGLAIIYSNLLGVDRRSILSFALVTSLLFTLVFVSPFSNRYKKEAHGNSVSDSNHGSYLIISSILSLFVGLCFSLVLVLYSRLISTLPINLFLTMIIYSVVSTLSFALQDFLPSIGRVRTAIISDVSLVILQVITFFFLLSINQLSVIVCVLVSLIFSYALHVFSISSIILFNQTRNSIINSVKKLINIQRLFLVSSVIHIVDRVDKLAIAFLLPLSSLAQFTTMAAFFAPIKVITEAASRQLYFSKLDEKQKNMEMNTSFRKVKLSFVLISLLLTPLFAGYFVNFTINLLLGGEWLLPTSLVVLYFSYEVIRGIYLYSLNSRIRSDQFEHLHKAPILLLVLSVLLVPTLTLAMGITGAIIAMITSYSLVLMGFKLAHAI